MAHTNFKGRRAIFPTWFLHLISWKASSKMQEIAHHLKKCVCGYVLLHIYLHTQMRTAAEQWHVLQVCWKWTLHVGCVSSISRLQTIVPRWGELRCGLCFVSLQMVDGADLLHWSPRWLKRYSLVAMVSAKSVSWCCLAPGWIVWMRRGKHHQWMNNPDGEALCTDMMLLVRLASLGFFVGFF